MKKPESPWNVCSDEFAGGIVLVINRYTCTLMRWDGETLKTAHDSDIGGVTFGALLTLKRAKTGLSQHGLARRLGVSASAVKSWETGDRNPNQKNYRKLMEVLK